MRLDDYVTTFGLYCKQNFNQRLQKLTIDAHFTCPNRDGTLGIGGCTFCNVASFSHEHQQHQQHQQQPLTVQSSVNPPKPIDLSISDQLQQGKKRLQRHAKRYLAYFQAYTSTYEEYELLKTKYDEALKTADIVGICVGTRPDCVPDRVLDLLKSYQEQGHEVWLELGLQSAHDKTLKRINRGHGFAAYQDAVTRAHLRGLKVCTHLILGLPNETEHDHLTTLYKILELGLEGIKLHPLHITQGSLMAKSYQAGRLMPPDLESYVHSAANLIRHTPKEIIYHRVTAYAKKPMLIAPNWCQYRWEGLTHLIHNLDRFGGQGFHLK